MQLSQSTIAKFGLGVAEVAPPDPFTHIPTQGVGSNILYNNNPSGTAVYDPNADGGFLRDIHTGAEIRPAGSTVLSYQAPKQISTAKTTNRSTTTTNPFVKSVSAANSFNSSVQSTSAPITRVNSTPSASIKPTSSTIQPLGAFPRNYTGAPISTAPSPTTGKKVSSGPGVQKPSSSPPTKITPAIQTAANNIGNILRNILNTALFGRR